MKVSLKLMAVMVLFGLCGGSPLHAGYEWWHHLNGMSVNVYDCMESCHHVDMHGQFTWTQQSVEQNVFLAPAVGAAQNLSAGTCYAQHSISLTLSATRNKSLSVSASDSVSGSVQYLVGAGWSAGESAKAAVSGSIGYSHSWDWTINQTHTEGWTASGATSVSWPESGERKATGPGAKVSLNGMIMGNRATYAQESK